MKAPCKNCPNKGCGSYHDQCEEYQTYRRATDQKRKDLKIANEIENLNFEAHGKISLKKKYGKK